MVKKEKEKMKKDKDDKESRSRHRDEKEKECEDDDIDTGDDDGDGVDQWWRMFDEIASNHNVTLNNIFPDGLGVIEVQGVQQMMKFCTQCHVWVHGLVSAHVDTEGR